jgi:carboxymethylenebutenolidase
MDWIELKSSDGHVLDAYIAKPAGEARGAIVVLQEIFGVNAHMRSVCDKYAQQGWFAIAPALFDRVAKSQALGYDAEGIAQGRELRGKLTDAQALRDVQAAIDLARAGSVKVAVIGFCWGGTLAWLAASRLEGVACAVAYYGTNIHGYLNETPKVPMLLHFGDEDTHIPPEHVAAIAKAFPQAELYRYPAGHGFNCDERPAFHAASAESAGARTEDFLKRELQC